MSIRRAGSIFDRAVKQTFNKNKYNNPTAKTKEGRSHLAFFSDRDIKYGRIIFTLGVACASFMVYIDPGYFHETFGHLPNPPVYDTIDNALDSKERKLNQQILEREKEEHKLHSFLDIFKNYGV